MEICGASVDAAAALSAVSRWIEAYQARFGRAPPTPETLLRRLVPVLTASRALSRIVAARPRLPLHLGQTPWFEVGPPEAILQASLERSLRHLDPDDPTGLDRALRRFKYRELLRIAARDLGGAASLQELLQELSQLASVCVEGALSFHVSRLSKWFGLPKGGDRPGAGLTILGMGKLGTGELNFSSDIDLICLYGGEGQTPGGSRGAVTHRRFYETLIRALIHSLSAVTEDGFVYRVDLDLRPEGGAGPLVQSVDSAFSYYEARGRTWERAALLKAWPIAGDREAGRRFLDALAPFVFRRSLDLEAVEEIRSIKGRIERESAAGPDHLKLGPGGIREVEFVAVALLLLHAGRNPRLRVRGTLPALDRLLFEGLLPAKERDVLATAWQLLRRAENHLQMMDERQTHRLPPSPEDRLRLARSLGFASAWELEAELASKMGEVRAIFDDLLATGGARPRPADPLLARALDPDATEESRLDALADKGFFHPAAALAELQRLQRRPDTPFFRPPPLSLEGEAERLLDEACRSPDPNQALRHLGDFTGSLRSPRPWFELLATHPATGRLLLQLFGTSDSLSRHFVRHPELVEPLLHRATAARRKPMEEMEAEVAARLARHGDVEGRLSALRRYKNEEILRIGLEDVSGILELEEVMEEITTLADLCVRECLALARAEMIDRWGAPREGNRLAVLAMGKMGGRELGYRSDLDLIFVFGSSEGESSGGRRGRLSAPEWFSRLAQRLISHLQLPLREGILFRVDTGLRPSGRQGTLVVSLAAFAGYHRGQSATWEKQALLRARFVAGDRGIATRALEIVENALSLSGDPAQEILAMRRRIEEEIAQETLAGPHPKAGRGGLMDVEFACQYLQLVHGPTKPWIRTPSTADAIRRLQAEGLLSGADAAVLLEAWRFLRRLELRLQIVQDRAADRLPSERFARLGLARRMGYVGERADERLLADYERITLRLREVFLGILGGG